MNRRGGTWRYQKATPLGLALLHPTKVHSLRRDRVDNGRELYVVESTPDGNGDAVHDWPPAIAGFNGSGGVGRRCVGHVTFREDRLLFPASRTPAIIQGGAQERVQLNFTYASHADAPMLDYTRATLAEWPASENISLGDAIAKYHRAGGEFGFFPHGGVSRSVALQRGEDTGEYARNKRFCFVPELVKARRQWWA